MPDISYEHLVHCLDAYASVTSLYLSYKGNPKPVAPRRAKLKQGVVAALPIDFICDVEIKAKRALTSADCRIFARCMHECKPGDVPQLTQILLGDTWMRHDMGYDSHYSVLYFRAKNDLARDREEPTHFVEEPEEQS
jgi:hypothetical protein